jgi:hypothetical protein
MVVLSIPLQMSLLATNEAPNIQWCMAAKNEPANAPVVEQARQPGNSTRDDLCALCLARVPWLPVDR